MPKQRKKKGKRRAHEPLAQASPASLADDAGVEGMDEGMGCLGLDEGEMGIDEAKSSTSLYVHYIFLFFTHTKARNHD